MEITIEHDVANGNRLMVYDMVIVEKAVMDFTSRIGSNYVYPGSRVQPYVSTSKTYYVRDFSGNIGTNGLFIDAPDGTYIVMNSPPTAKDNRMLYIENNDAGEFSTPCIGDHFPAMICDGSRSKPNLKELLYMFAPNVVGKI